MIKAYIFLFKVILSDSYSVVWNKEFKEGREEGGLR